MGITSQNIFHPYKIVNEGRSTLQLEAGAAQKIAVYAFRIMPLLMLITGIVLYTTQKEVVFLFTFGGIALIEALVFSFIKIPASLSMDSMGFTLELLSIKGKKEVYYLWSDVDFIRYQTVRAKNNTSLNYEAVLKTGKKRGFLNFANYHSKKEQLQEINTVLHDISRKEVREG